MKIVKLGEQGRDLDLLFLKAVSLFLSPINPFDPYKNSTKT